MGDIAEALIDVVGPERVAAGAAISEDYSHDEALTATARLPEAVVRPTTTAEVAAIVALADDRGIPVTARGSGTGLSGACIPAAGGIVVSFERMNQILEIDTENHVAVVQPGVTLDQLDEVTAGHGLVYPVFPGEYSASLGGNVATNAGGMRAVKYGVTRHQVLGLEAVLASGEVIRTGGKFVKATTGYDLTQLIVGSEGTLALVTEATLKLHPRAAHAATVLAPFATLDQVTAAVPRIVDSGVGPLILEYIDLLTMAAVTANVGLDLGIPADIKDAALAYLVVMLENTHADRLDADTEQLAELVSELGAIDVYVLPPGAASQLIDAREKAFWVAKANGADDIVDVVVPRASIPEFMRAGVGARGRQRLVDRRLRPRRRRQRAPLGVPERPRGPRPRPARAVRAGHRPRRRDLGRARHRHGEAPVLPRARGPGQGRAHAPDQGGVRPQRHPQPRHHLRLPVDPAPTCPPTLPIDCPRPPRRGRPAEPEERRP